MHCATRLLTRASPACGSRVTRRRVFQRRSSICQNQPPASIFTTAVNMPRKQKNQAEDIEDLIDEEPPKSINPYHVLGVVSDATPDQIKSAYRKAALKHHPGKLFLPIFDHGC